MYKGIYIPPIDLGLGYIEIHADDIGITYLEFADHLETTETPNAIIDQCKQQLAEYFAKTRTEFTVPLHLIGTPFQMKAWQALMKIPYGVTYSYKQQALTLGSVNYSRAVGSANSKNPISIIVPCHRVIGSNQKLVGYAGGLNRKQTLLALEKN